MEDSQQIDVNSVFVAPDNDFEVRSSTLISQISELRRLLNKDRIVLDDSIESALAEFWQINQGLPRQVYEAKFISLLEEQFEILIQKCHREGIQI